LQLRGCPGRSGPARGLGCGCLPVRASGFVWVHGREYDAAFCEAPERQAWLLEKADEVPLPDPYTFWEDIPALPRVPKEALKALFQASKGRQDYYWVDGTGNWAASWDGTVIREVADSYYVERAARGRWDLLDGRLFEALSRNEFRNRFQALKAPSFRQGAQLT